METHFAKDGLMSLFSDSSDPTIEYTRMRELMLAGFQSLKSADVVSTSPDLTYLTSHFLNSEGPEQAVPIETYMSYLVENVIAHSVHTGSPRCLGHMTGVLPNFTLILGELILALNQNLVKREASKTFSLLEREAIAMMHRLIYGFSDQFYSDHVQSEESSLGAMVTGGTLANITALWIARNACLGPSNGFAGVEQEGLPAALDHYGYEGAVIIGSQLMHYSLEKAAGLLGLGSRGLIAVPVDKHNRLNILELKRTVAKCLDRRQCVIAIVGIAGTTDCGSMDPLAEIAEIAGQAGIHFHVDAAWGAPLMFSRLHRSKLAGIERANSVTADGHKQLYMPIGTSVLLLRDPHIAKLIEKRSNYILREGSGDLGQRSLEGSRGATALFLHAAINLIGRQGYEFLIDENLRKTRAMAALIKSSTEFELLLEPETNIVLYRYIPKYLRAALAQARLSKQDNLAINRFNEQLQQIQYESGRTFVSRTTWNGVSPPYDVPLVALRAVIANPLTDETDLQRVLDDQIKIAAGISQETTSEQHF